MSSDYASIWLDEITYYGSSGSEDDEVKRWLVSRYSDSDTSDAGSDSDDEQPENNTTANSENNTLQSHSGYIYGRNKYKWFKEAPSPPAHQTKQPADQREPTTNLTDNDVDFMSIWKNLIDDQILQEILRWTNVKLTKSRASATENNNDLQELDIVELLSFIGVLVYSGLFGFNGYDADIIFDASGFSVAVFRYVMSRDRFINLLKCFRFDDSNDNKEGKRESKNLSAISKIFQMFVNNCQKLYNPGKHVTVDEISIPFKEPPCLTQHRRRCDKQSLQIMCLCDAKNGYFYNGYIYKGPNSDNEGLTEDEKPILARSVLHLSRPLHGTDRNVTCGKCFTSIELIESLRRNGLSCVGAVQKSLREVPTSFLPSKERKVGSTLYAFTDQITLVSHVPYRRKAIVVASSMHEDKNKTDIVRCYMSTCNGVAGIIEKRDQYSCARHTRRGSLAIFYWILDISLINTLIAYKVHHGKKIRRAEFLEQIAHSLVVKQLHRRVFDTQLPLELRKTIMRLLGPEE